MKISFQSGVKYLTAGSHRVKIASVTYGKSSRCNTPYFECKFINENGIIYNKFYITKNSLSVIKKLFEAVRIDRLEVDTNELPGKILNIKIKYAEWIDKETGELIKKCPEVYWFEKEIV